MLVQTSLLAPQCEEIAMLGDAGWWVIDIDAEMKNVENVKRAETVIFVEFRN